MVIVKKNRGRDKTRQGAVLIMFYLILAGLLILLAGFMGRSLVENKASARNTDILQAYYLAEAGIDQVKRELYNAFLQAYPLPSNNDFNWFDGLIQSGQNQYSFPAGTGLANVSSGQYTVSVSQVTNLQNEVRDVALTSTATVNNVTKTISAVVRYRLGVWDVFDHAYFVNNLGWFWGGGITAQGDIRSNGDFSFRGNPKVNGDIYASENPDLGAEGEIEGNSRNDSIAAYRSTADSTARPTDPPADGLPGYEGGYDGNSDRNEEQPVVNIPPLGDLSYYRNLAVALNGRITQCNNVLVNNTLSGNIVLEGTDACPIQVSGLVVVDGDVLIKGRVTGQGTIYSGRNTHIIGDINYVNPPAWPKPDSDPQGTDTQNAARDFLGLATKGNVIVGDYTRWDWQVNVARYLRPPFTRSYEVDSTDSPLGYDSDGNPNNGYLFNGDYTAYDGGQKTDGRNRKFYESSYDDNYFRSIAVPGNQIRRVDAVVYTNHAFSGRVGSFTMNGSIISRDEAIVYSGSITMNYDIRAMQSGMSFGLPRQMVLPTTEYLRRND